MEYAGNHVGRVVVNRVTREPKLTAQKVGAMSETRIWVTAIGSSNYVQVNIGVRKPKTHYCTDDTWNRRAAKKLLGELPKIHSNEWIEYKIRAKILKISPPRRKAKR